VQIRPHSWISVLGTLCLGLDALGVTWTSAAYILCGRRGGISAVLCAALALLVLAFRGAICTIQGCWEIVSLAAGSGTP
jgi:MFS superfamily sulfate permease-like transporter